MASCGDLASRWDRVQVLPLRRPPDRVDPLPFEAPPELDHRQFAGAQRTVLTVEDGWLVAIDGGEFAMGRTGSRRARTSCIRSTRTSRTRSVG
jgi:hypothetical protein